MFLSQFIADVCTAQQFKQVSVSCNMANECGRWLNYISIDTCTLEVMTCGFA